MPLPFAIPAALKIGGLLGASALGGALSNRKKTTTQTNTPTLDPKFRGLQDMLMQQTMSRLQEGGMPKGYETGQIGEINNTFDLIGKSQANNLTARGLGSSPIAGMVDGNREMARGGEIVRMQREIPQMARANSMQDMLMAQGLLGQGRGSTQSQTDPGNMLGGGFNGMADMLGFLMGQGGMGGGAKKPPVNIGGAALPFMQGGGW